HCIGATTLDEYRKHIEKDAALERRFQPVLVDQPSVEDTISILRGLKERYEVHHGVRIQDSALVAAAMLSDRYISDRFLPDKAIDLVDEAASKLRMEIDSMPVELDELERRIMQLEIEREALKKESDKASRERLGKLEKELADHKEARARLASHWQQQVDAHSGEPAHGRGSPEAHSHGRAAAPARHRTRRCDHGRLERDSTRARRTPGSKPAARQLHVPRSDRRRQDGARPSARRVPVR